MIKPGLAESIRNQQNGTSRAARTNKNNLQQSEESAKSKKKGPYRNTVGTRDEIEQMTTGPFSESLWYPLVN